MSEQTRQGRHWGALTWGLLGLAVGLAAGLWWGSYAGACIGSDQCSSRWDAVGAVGTWVGGLGTIAAVLVAARAFLLEDHLRRKAEQETASQRAESAAVEFAAAQLITIEAMFGSWSAEVINEVRVQVRNATSQTPVYKVHLRVPKLGREFEVHSIEGGDVRPFSHHMYPGSGYPSIVVKDEDREEWIQQLIETCSMTFEMNDRHWSRVGTQPANLRS
ncbi:hypothetical protein [Humibacillus xanthopallidus]|uniref:Uncharacterized protein n=1 Tax=Humibacillus xanthopallidus TaxID=412689 RepID=A0A543HZM8_9MICO|nr:hypothetical protein [Humibacillus xanthopallidus]TQM63730.1 hypothetical protein FBY41_0075 [Humibacillus xanthopallidus]